MPRVMDGHSARAVPGLSRPADYAAGVSIVVLRYTLLRLALFVVVLAVLAIAGARGILLLGLTVAVSIALSYLLLRRQRDAVAAAIAERVQGRLEAPRNDGGTDEAVEDAEDEARRAEHARDNPGL
jgi:hypothetical protein